MSFFENVGKRMSETGQAAIQKARTVSETARLNIRIGELQKDIQGLYARIGEQYVRLHADGPEADLAELVGAVREAEGQIAQCQEAIAKLSDARTCPSCGAVLGGGAAFCSVCGAAVPEDAPVKAGAGTCPKCGGPVDPGAAFCPKCGSALDGPAGPVCASCGAALVPGNKFCIKCGAPVPEAPASGGPEDSQGRESGVSMP